VPEFPWETELSTPPVAQLRLVARPKGNPFGAPIYIEATVEFVDNDKYGKDMGKLAMLRQLEPDAQLLIVSTKGFSLPVKESRKNAHTHSLISGPFRKI